MKKRLRGIICIWLAFIMAISVLPVSALGAVVYLVQDVVDDETFDFINGEQSYNITLDVALDGQSSIMSEVDDVTPDGYELAGWKLWQGFVYSGDLSLLGSEDLEADGVIDDAMYSFVEMDPDAYFLALEPLFEEKTKYLITFEDEDTSVIQSTEVEYGVMPTPPANPTKAPDAEYTYEFSGWTPALEEVTGEATYTATYSATKNKYLITFEDEDTSVIQSTEVEYGVMPTPPTNPTKAPDAEYTYEFSGWTPALEEVTGEATYTATYASTPIGTNPPPAVHTVSFETNGGSAVPDVTVNDGDIISAPTNPTRSGYTFKGWYEDEDFNEKYYFDTPVTDSFTIYAKWQRRFSGGGGGIVHITVKLETNGGKGATEETVTLGSKLAEPPKPRKEGFVFDGWYSDEALENLYDFESKVTGNITLYAKWRKQTVSDFLDTSKHSAYIKGDDNGMVRPEDKLTRAETTEIFFRLLNEKTRSINLAYVNEFKDTDKNAWYNTSVSTMAKMGIIKGREDNCFAPGALITRAEFAAICARLDDSDYEKRHSFSDIEGHWAESEIYEAASRGWINGYEDGSFRPDEHITRAEAIAMINRMTGRTPASKDSLHTGMKKWADNTNEDAWYYVAVQEATNDHSYTKTSDGNEKWTALD